MSIAWESDNNGKRPTNQPVEEFCSSNISINRKIKAACEGLLPNLQRLFLELHTDEDKELIADFLNACIAQENISINTRKVYLSSLVYLSRHLGNKKSFRDITNDDLFDYLNSLRRPAALDPDQRWINTRNQRAMVFSKFFRWLAYPKLSLEERKRLQKQDLPPLLRGLTFLNKKGSKSPVKAKDIWTDEDTALFLKYCLDLRLACFHAMARDTSARPGELLAVRLGDIEIKKTAEGKMYVQLEVGRYGKRKKPRIVPMTTSIPYYRSWLALHPLGSSGNPDAFLFLSMERGAKYLNKPISGQSLRADYVKMRDQHLPALLKPERPDIPLEEKLKIQELLKKEKWNPYVMRHSSITMYIRKVKNEYIIKQHSGWEKTSKMVEVYTHEKGGESCDDVLLACGIDVNIGSNRKGGASRQHQQLQDLLELKTCHHCKMLNKHDSQFCTGCGLVLTLEAFEEARREGEKAKKKLHDLENRQAYFEKEIVNKMDRIERMYHSYTRGYLESRTEHIKDNRKKREEEMEAIALSEPAAMEKIEEEEAWEEEAIASARAVSNEEGYNMYDDEEEEEEEKGYAYPHRHNPINNSRKDDRQFNQ